MSPILSKKAKIALAVGTIILLESEKKKKRVWVKEWLQKRDQFTHLRLLKCIQSCEPLDVINYLRMDYDLFREAVSVEERLLATLRFLATGRSYEDLKFSCIISPQLLGRIIPETCRAIYNCLRKKYLCFPSKEEEWLKVAEGFNNMWQFENCLGAVDGKHIAIKQPPGSGSHYYNYKELFSLVLFAIVNANYEFTYVSCGTNGRISDGGVIKKTDFYNLLITDSLKLPQPVNMRGIQNKLLFVFIGDEAFSLMTNFMTPYRQTNSIGYEEKCFNYRLCRARRIVPTVPNGWKKIANYYNNLWNFPMCLGSMDGKHIIIQSPKFSGSEYINYKGTFSIVLFAIVDANYNFIYVYIGCQGRISDGGVFKNSGFAKALDKSMLNFPQPTILPGRQKPVPYVLVADDAFPLSENILKPFAGNQDRGSRQRIFNYRLSRARRVVENAFGILASVFRCLRKPMLLEPEKVEKITMACVTLHNFLRRNAQAKDLYTPPGSFDAEDLELGTLTEGAWRKDSEVLQSFMPIKKVARKSSYIAKEIRDEFSEYFVSEIGQVPWQSKYN
ncbi:unnamed protein product [Acanthoscelides obtectus]|uniref:DDE Tnp4 domain-containing protein n=1 Tax=Acanthoscelides obtectus TaxID=200917 RepID=A0A9P0LIR7_ACAOB|nr:unnamed protein product [Acanthoscelides obtectus]CAK1680703.1 Protein ALP1-like [Acanthoscelides obtectus]